MSRANNFDLIRLFAAIQVLIAHSKWQLNIKSFMPLLGYFPGVLMFFTISGFLVFSSLERNKNIKQYFLNRFLRIYPALWVCIGVTILFILFTSNLTFKDFISFDFIGWTLAQFTLFQFWTPDLLRDWGFGTPNGSLWTIPVEIQFYILLPIILLKFKRIKLLYKLVLLVIFSIGSNLTLSLFESIDKTNVFVKLIGVSIFPYLYSFIFGMIIYKYWSYLKQVIVGKAFIWLILFFLFCYFTKSYPSYQPSSVFGFIANLFLSLLTISMAYTLPKLNNLLRGNDISYGIYIYHMPILNVFVTFGLMKDVKYLWMVLITAFVFAIMSWILIEKRVLQLKENSRILSFLNKT